MILNNSAGELFDSQVCSSDAAIAAAPNPAQPNAIHMKEENHEP